MRRSRLAAACVAVALLFLSSNVIGQGDTCADARDIEAGTFSGSTEGASSDGSATCASSDNSPDEWFRFTAPEDGVLSAETCGNDDYDTALAIYSDCPGDESNELECNDDSCGLRSRVSHRVDAGSSYLIRVSGYNRASGEYTLNVAFGLPPEPGDGADIAAAATGAISQVGRLGSTVALSMSSTLCNLGDEAIDWYGNPNPRHPFLVFNVFRDLDGRMEQIGQSWIKHGFAAAQSSGLCGNLPCDRDSNGNLGPGCADIYGSGTNASQRNMGPRDEVNPWTGAFVYEGSHLDTTGTTHNPVEHRLAVDDADLDRDANEGARYFLELYTVCHDDIDHENSVGYQEFMIASGGPGGTWRFTNIDTVATQGTSLEAWPDATRTTIPEGDLVEDGRAYCYVRVRENGPNKWRYEYAVYNLDMARNVGSFSVPISDGALVENIGFHAPVSDDDYSNAPWASNREGGMLTWSTTPHEVDPLSNPIRWGSAYNFWFDAGAPPTDSEVTLGVFDGGGTLSGPAVGPSSDIVVETVFRRSDADGNGAVDITDPVTILGTLFAGSGPLSCPDAADANDDNAVDVSDAVYTLLWLFSGGEAPPPPGGDECGVDETPSTLAACVYDSGSC